MGFSLKKVVKSVAAPILKVAAAPITVPLAIVNKVGLSEEVKSLTTVDTKNLKSVIDNTTKLQGSTGSDEFKGALYDSVKMGLAAAGGAGAITGATATGGVLLTAKAQAGGGINLGELGALAGLPTNLGGVDLGNFNVVKPKTVQPIFDSFPEMFEDVYQEVTAPKNSNYVYIGIGVLAIVGILIIRKIKK